MKVMMICGQLITRKADIYKYLLIIRLSCYVRVVDVCYVTWIIKIKIKIKFEHSKEQP